MNKKDYNKLSEELNDTHALKKLFEFIKNEENHSIVKEYRQDCFQKAMTKCKTEKEKYLALFLDSINAGGIGKLDKKSLAKAIDEYNYVSITLPKLKEMKAQRKNKKRKAIRLLLNSTGFFQ